MPFEMRWARGFTCERCGYAKYSRMMSCKHIQCNAGKQQTRFTADTIAHGTKLPPVTWFHAIYAITLAEGGSARSRWRNDWACVSRRSCAVFLTAPPAQSDVPPANGRWPMKQKPTSTPPGPPRRGLPDVAACGKE